MVENESFANQLPDNWELIFYRNKKLNEIYKDYIENIKPLIALIEAEREQFPITVFNELRAAYDHIIRCYEEKTNNKIDEHVKCLHGHNKRAKLDCFKELILTYDDKIKLFKREYRYYNISIVDNGNFLADLNMGMDKSKKLTKEAKISEGKHDNINIVLKKYSDAIDQYINTYSLIEKFYENKKHVWVVNTRNKSIFIKILIFSLTAVTSGFIGYFINCLLN